MRWREIEETGRERQGTRNVLIGAAAVVGLALLAVPFMPSIRRYLRRKRM